MEISIANINFTGLSSINGGNYNYNFSVNISDKINFSGSVVVTQDDIDNNSGNQLKKMAAQTIADAVSKTDDVSK